MVDSFDFDFDSHDGQRLLEGLHDISNGEELSEATLEVARRLTPRA
jgi:hypothetical protein